MDLSRVQRRYDRLIGMARKRAKSRKEAQTLLPDEVIHEHHIIPKCLGGANRRSNYAYLTTREHIRAHELLALLNPTHIGLGFAADLLRLDFDATRRKKTAHDIKRLEDRLLVQTLEKAISKFEQDGHLKEYQLKKYKRELKQLREELFPTPEPEKEPTPKPEQEPKKKNFGKTYSFGYDFLPFIPFNQPQSTYDIDVINGIIYQNQLIILYPQQRHVEMMQYFSNQSLLGQRRLIRLNTKRIKHLSRC